MGKYEYIDSQKTAPENTNPVLTCRLFFLGQLAMPGHHFM